MDKFVCDKCGKVDTVLVSGYHFGDRLLEGVVFRVKNVKGKPKVVEVTEGKEYFESLNKKKWIKACEDYCKQLDEANCGKCDDYEVAVWGADIPRPAPKVIGMTSMMDILKGKPK